jgi:acetyl esterase/lipase
MKHYLTVAFLLLFHSAYSQPAARLTGIRDTSYSTRSDFANNLKKHPEIKVVADIPIKSVRERRNLIYCTLGKRELKIDAFTPKGKKNVPAILIIHGGGWRSGDRTQHIPMAQYLAQRGFACFTVEYRLSTEALYPAAVYDLKAAVRWVRANASRFSVETSKVATIGFSAGGELAAFLGVTSGLTKFEKGNCNTGASSSVQAVIDIDGTLSFVSPDSWETQNVNKLNASAWWIGYPRTDTIALWTEASPLTYAARNKAPFLFLNSSIERMHAGRDAFAEIAQARGVAVEIKAFENSPHSFCLYEPWFLASVDRITTFLNGVFKIKPHIP